MVRHDTAEVLVTAPVPGSFHYRVPARFAATARLGARVLVRFGGKQITGVIMRTGTPPPPELKKLLDITDVLDDEPALSAELLDLCLWIASYYEAPPGEVIKAALPAGSGVKAHRVLSLTASGAAMLAGALPPKARALLGRLEHGPIASAGLSATLKKGFTPLIEQGWVAELDEREAARTRLKQERVAELAVPIDEARRATARAPKRLAVVEALVEGARAIHELDIANATAAVRELEKAKLVRTFEREAALDAAPIGDALKPTSIPTPTDEQAFAIAAIIGSLRERTNATNAAASPQPSTARELSPFLLHGVTGSGKTEVYLRVIAEALELGKTALVLVPEIALTPQLAARFRARFGDSVAVLHSGMSRAARLGEWRGCGAARRGSRSARGRRCSRRSTNLGVIVVDEEHDGSFKQEEGVRYHARDVALVRAQRAGAVCVLGSATPSLESYAHAERGHYTLLVLTQRPTSQPMPTVEVVDLRTHVPDGEAMLSAPLRIAIGETLAAGEQSDPVPQPARLLDVRDVPRVRPFVPLHATARCR